MRSGIGKEIDAYVNEAIKGKVHYVRKQSTSFRKIPPWSVCIVLVAEPLRSIPLVRKITLLKILSSTFLGCGSWLAVSSRVHRLQ